MFRKILGLLILGLVLASCGEVITPIVNKVKSVTPTEEVGQIKVSWTFEGDKAAISGFKVYRAVGSGSYASIYTATSAESSYTDKAVAVGTKYKYGVSVIGKDGKEVAGSRLDNSTAVEPKPVASTDSMNGKWTLDSVVTKTPVGKEADLGRKFFFIIDITESSAGVLTGTVNLRDEGTTVPSAPFGESKVEGTKNTDGTYTFKMIEKSEDPATTDILEEKSWTVTVLDFPTTTTFTGTYKNVFGFEGTVAGTKIP